MTRSTFLEKSTSKDDSFATSQDTSKNHHTSLVKTKNLPLCNKKSEAKKPQKVERKTKVNSSNDTATQKEAIVTKYPKYQTDILMKWMIENKKNPCPNSAAIEELMSLTGLSAQQITNWTTNVRKRNVKATTKGGKKPHHFIDFFFLAYQNDLIDENNGDLSTSKRALKTKRHKGATKLAPERLLAKSSSVPDAMKTITNRTQAKSNPDPHCRSFAPTGLNVHSGRNKNQSIQTIPGVPYDNQGDKEAGDARRQLHDENIMDSHSSSNTKPRNLAIWEDAEFCLPKTPSLDDDLLNFMNLELDRTKSDLEASLDIDSKDMLVTSV